MALERTSDNTGRDVFVRLCNSNCEDVAPTLSVNGVSKGTQRQLDNGGGYTLVFRYASEELK